LKLKQQATGEDKSAHPAWLGRLYLFGRAFLHRDVIVVLLVAWTARLIFMLTMPPEARSFDTHSWESVANDLKAGGNPYQTTFFLNWPPFWLQLIFVISKISTALSIPFFRVLQVFLILVESVVIILLTRLIREIAPEARVRTLVIIGLALNPAAILLICQHCNFDVIVALWLMLFMLNLLRYNRTNDYADWLCACLFLGLGILTKTVPLFLIPLLAGGFREATTRLKFLGLVLLVGPVTLGVSIIYVLAPADVTTKVFEYRSQGETFGFSGLFHLAGVDQMTVFYNLFFYLLLFTVMILSSILFWRRKSIRDQETVLLAALLLAGIPVLGPGYGPQYLYWFMPFLVATCAFFKGKWRRVLIGFALIAVCTYLVEYALVGADGMFLLKIMAHRANDIETLKQAYSLVPVITKCESLTGLTLIRLPLFAAYLTLLVVGTSVLLRGIKDQSSKN
jgi:hypothetical protein